MSARSHPDDGRRRVELHLRNPAGYGAYSRQAAVVERLEQLREAGAVDDYSVETWGKSIELCTGDEVDGLCATLDKYWEWAEQSVGSLEPAFRRRRVTGPDSERTHELLTLPVICLAVYTDDELVAVAPCSNGETVYTVSDALDDLESKRLLVERLP